MAEHNIIGKEGENQAVQYLRTKGYVIRDRNWHYHRNELDIIAETPNELVVIEVKTRKNEAFGNPEEAVDNRKIRRIITASQHYIQKYKIDKPTRFDIIAILAKENIFEIKHIKDAFHTPIW
jgi:putative endonuclease